MAAEGLAARAAAVGLLGAVLGEGRLMAQVVADAQGPLAGLPPSDRARAQRLALAVLRHLEQADRVLEPHLRKAPPRMVRDALRLAVVEIAMGGAAHGAVNAAVEIVRRGKRTGHMAGLVNAVLRKVPDQPFEGLPPQRMPRWLRQPLVHAYGREVVSAMEAVQAEVPPLDLTLRAGAVVPEGEVLPTGSLRLEEKGQVSALAGYEAGGWWVQDAAAALAVRLLAPVAGERVLDLCSAPGGKTLQIASSGAGVVSVDVSEARMGRVRENLARCGLEAELVVADALVWEPGERFDAVLLDAPCSATGTIRRHPDLPFVKDGSEVAGLVELQAAMLDRALAMVRPGGRVVFCTCSLLPEEGEGQLAAALERHPGLRVERAEVPGVDPAWWTEGGGLRLRPDLWAARGGMDGFFMVRLGVS
ncbi:RsmB/NOP family class I SAM-dependent RNA methyltransferase [Tabrizicola sp. M-4]|uniref:RsmB/NOP family class I SAM-dependent RNA methyltransferase n=1 Tax=Tabrizicola sp. M-4 TaxID=3055847 RepID=UPI003DA94444